MPHEQGGVGHLCALMDSENDTKKSFYEHFQETQIGLEAQIGTLPSLEAPARTEAIDTCLAAISQLSDVVKDASSYLPAYDQRSYSETIRALSEKLAGVRKALAPKQRFSFKNRKKDSAASIGGAFKISSYQDSPSQEKSISGVPEADNLVISGVEGAHIRPPLHATSLASNSFPSLLLSWIDGCVISFPSERTLFSSAAVKNVNKSLLYFGGAISGPLHLTGLSDATVVVACRQLRMHEASNIDLYLFCPSRPTIEDCTCIRFAPLGKKGLGSAWEAAEENLWDQVDDFKWLKSEHSPNWSVLPEEVRVEWYTWKEIGEKGVGELSVEETLNSLVRKP